jgi:hypothetical protein
MLFILCTYYFIVVGFLVFFYIHVSIFPLRNPIYPLILASKPLEKCLYCQSLGASHLRRTTGSLVQTYATASAGERGTSYAEMNRAGCANAKKGPKKDYNAFKDFHDSETTAHILASWIHFTGMEKLEG